MACQVQNNLIAQELAQFNKEQLNTLELLAKLLLQKKPEESQKDSKAEKDGNVLIALMEAMKNNGNSTVNENDTVIQAIKSEGASKANNDSNNECSYGQVLMLLISFMKNCAIQNTKLMGIFSAQNADRFNFASLSANLDKNSAISQAWGEAAMGAVAVAGSLGSLFAAAKLASTEYEMASKMKGLTEKNNLVPAIEQPKISGVSVSAVDVLKSPPGTEVELPSSTTATAKLTPGETQVAPDNLDRSREDIRTEFQPKIQKYSTMSSMSTSVTQIGQLPNAYFAYASGVQRGGSGLEKAASDNESAIIQVNQSQEQNGQGLLGKNGEAVNNTVLAEQAVARLN